MGGLQLDANGVFNGIIAALLLAGGTWALGWAKLRLGLLNDRISLKIMRAELRKVLELQQAPEKIAAFLLYQLLCCVAILGVGIAYAPIAFMDGGAKWMGPGLALLGLSIYVCAIYALGIVVRVRKGPEYVRRHEEKIAALEKAIERRGKAREQAQE